MTICLNMLTNKLVCLFIVIAGLGTLNPQSLLLAAAPGEFNEFLQTQGRKLNITNITTNIADYINNEVPAYEKFEATFQVEGSVAGNYQLPYDANPPKGIDLSYPKHQGISVDALFLPPGETDWGRAYQQPAFYYESFDDQIKKDESNTEKEWYYPTGDFAWKVRFSPDVPGIWQFKIKAQDASGLHETQPQLFTVANSSHKGFIKVSRTDARYFEFDDGTNFNGWGFNYDPNLDNPVLKNEPDFQRYRQNNINFLRIWISKLYGAAWLRYVGGRNLYDGYLPRPGLFPFSDSTMSRIRMTLRIDYEPDGDTGWFDACRFEAEENSEAVKQNTTYRIRVKYRGIDIEGPRDSASPKYGLVVKLGGWYPNCYESGTGTVVTGYGLNNSDWQYIEGVWISGNNNFLPRFHLALENVTQGEAYIDSISIQELTGNGKYGPEIMVEPSMAYELYFPQESSYALDKFIELAEQNDIYLKMVLMDKDDKIYLKIQDNGDFVTTGPDNLNGFYGTGRTLNKTRWLQQAWWRYVQARWGYSSHIHSWELTNEGDPFNVDHYALADELGKFMHCQVFGVSVGANNGDKCLYDHPNDHLVTTSFWHSFPSELFWANKNYPNVDYADVHAYISTGWQEDPSHEHDTAKFHLDYSADVRDSLDWYASQSEISTKPIIRGETGIDVVDEQKEQSDLTLDTEGVWLHNFLWSTLDPGALLEMYWWANNIQEQPGPDGKAGLYEIYGSISTFMREVPLNNGNYQDLAASVSNTNMRVVGQKDLANQQAHLWIQNKQHTWRNVVDGISSVPVSGSITLSGFQAGQSYSVQWFDTLDGKRILKTEIVKAQFDGDLELSVTNLESDVAVKVFRQ